jgi:hypothetical protein
VGCDDGGVGGFGGASGNARCRREDDGLDCSIIVRGVFVTHVIVSLHDVHSSCHRCKYLTPCVKLIRLPLCVNSESRRQPYEGTFARTRRLPATTPKANHS